MKTIIGIDPDSTKHGVAVYVDGKLIELTCMSLMELMHYMTAESPEPIEIHIENVCGQNAAFGKKGVANARAATAINRSVGKCQQAQLEVERMCEYLGVKVVQHKISKQWKSGSSKEAFTRITGWTGRSNEDSRSASWFGYQGVLMSK